MTFERIILVRLLRGDVLKCTTSFDTSDCVACAVEEGGDDAGLVFEWRGGCLEDLCRVLEVDDLDPAVGGSDYEEGGVADGHGVDAIFASNSGDGVPLAKIPVFESLVPAAGDEHLGIVEGKSLNGTDGFVVGGDDLLWLHLGAPYTEIEHVNRSVHASAEDSATILGHSSMMVFVKGKKLFFAPNSNNIPKPALDGHASQCLFQPQFVEHCISAQYDPNSQPQVTSQPAD